LREKNDFGKVKVTSKLCHSFFAKAQNEGVVGETMIPSWIYGLMVKNRTNSCMASDEHGRPIEEPVPVYNEKGLAFPGYGDRFDESAVSEKGLVGKVSGRK